MRPDIIQRRTTCTNRGSFSWLCVLCGPLRLCAANSQRKDAKDRKARKESEGRQTAAFLKRAEDYGKFTALLLGAAEQILTLYERNVCDAQRDDGTDAACALNLCLQSLVDGEQELAG